MSLTIAVSRESGARGTTIARRVGEKLGWQVCTQEFLEHSAQNELVRQDILDGLSVEEGQWVQEQVERSPLQDNPARHPAALELLRLILALSVQGEVILIGRGAGFILPRSSTLHVRLVAPLLDRIAYTSQWLRLTQEEAVEQVRLRDLRRDEYIETHFHRSPADIHQYDLALNSSFIGEDLAAELIVQAARGKLAAMFEPPTEKVPVSSEVIP